MRILYVTTTFPVRSETFLQREVRALRDAGVELAILSLHRGDARFEGLPIRRFSKLSLLRLLYLLPIALFRRGGRLGEVARAMATRSPASFLNLMENLLAFGAAIVEERRLRVEAPQLIHCVWGSAPAAFGLLANRLTGIPFSMGAHAYDVFEHGGDWLLRLKARSAILVHVSTDVVARRLLRMDARIPAVRIRRGLCALPSMGLPRQDRSRLRIVCIARLVEKKGFPWQLAIYAALAEAGIDFEARIVGEGPLARSIAEELEARELAVRVRLMGRLEESEVQRQLEWADVLFHTGVVARSGDRDGLPNVVPEAMAAGAVVVASPVSGVKEAIEDGVNGFLCPPGQPRCWVERCRRLQADDGLFDRLRRAARIWVEREFVAERNSRELLGQLDQRLAAAKSLDRA